MTGDIHSSPEQVKQEARGDWLLTSYADVARALRDVRFGHPPARNALGAEWVKAVGLPAGREKIVVLHAAVHRLMNLWITGYQPPHHGRLRTIMAGFFSSEAMARWRPRVQSLTDELLDRATAKQRMDIVGDLARPVSVTIIKEILGLQPEDLPQLMEWSRGMERILVFGQGSEDTARGVMAIAAFAEFFRDKAADPSRLPAGVLQALVEARQAGQLGEDELLANSTLLLFAAHTTMQQLIPRGLLALTRHPDQLQLLRDDPSLMPSAVEEMLRYISPTQMFTRQALEDVQLGDKPIRAGDLVRLHLGAANHDPEQFPDPDRFDIRRSPNPHLAFGGGMHHCLGFLLARLEASVVFDTLLRRLPRVSVVEAEIEWEDPVRQRRLTSLPVTF